VLFLLCFNIFVLSFCSFLFPPSEESETRHSRPVHWPPSTVRMRATHLRDNVVINQAGRAVKIIGDPVVVGVAREIRPDDVVDELAPGWLGTRRCRLTNATDYLIPRRSWTALVCECKVHLHVTDLVSSCLPAARRLFLTRAPRSRLPRSSSDCQC
jgi:hypothetical protein